MRRILLVSYHFPPSQAVGAQRAERLVRLLPEFGYHVDVICAAVDSRHPPTDPPSCGADGGDPGVHRVPTPFPFGRDPGNPPPRGAVWATAWWKLRAYSELLLLTREWAWRWGEAACRALRSWIVDSKFHLMILDAPPNPSVVPFLRLARENGIPTVMDFRDMWEGKGRALPGWGCISPSRRRAEWERRLREEAILSADHLVTTSIPIMKAMREIFPGLSPAAFTVIPNAFRQVDPVPDPEADPTAPGPMRIAYTGSLAYGRAEQLENFIRGMAEARCRGGPEVELTVVGQWEESLMRLAEREGVGPQVRGLGWVLGEKARKLQRDADVLLLLQPERYAGLAIPAKFFDYMARRRNILGLVGDGVTAGLIREHDLGVVAASETPEEIARALSEVAERVRIRPFLPPPPEQYSERHTVSEFARVLDDLLAESGRP